MLLYRYLAKLGAIIVKFYKNILLLFLLLITLFFISLYGWRVDFFRIIDNDGKMLFSSPTTLGHIFITRYIHSVELTPVEDEYYVVSGKLWSWEERTRSTKAGMPFKSPKNGRFIKTKQWLIYQGGRLSWNSYYYRIGNELLGLNQANFEPLGRRDFYKIFPGKKLNIEVYRAPYKFSRTYLVRELTDAPSFVPEIEHK